MKQIVVLLLVTALASVAFADRPDAIEVINTFKTVAPQYAGVLDRNEVQVLALKNQTTDKIASFHNDIITLKETFVVAIIRQEDALADTIANQNTSVADTQCMAFVARETNETVHLAGVAYTSCINAADEALETTAQRYYGRIGNLTVAITDLRLLDVFRGDNVFYTPANILTKLRNKLTELNAKTGPATADDLEEQLEELEEDLVSIRDTYIACMTTTERRFRDFVALAQLQLTAICSATLPQATPAP